MELKKYLTPEQLEQWHSLIGAASNVVVVGHPSPDGDAMGSILALTRYLQNLGKNAVPMTPNACPDFLQWLPGNEQVVVYRNKTRKAKEILADSDLVFCLDFNGLGRLEEMRQAVSDCPAPRIMIDHHLDPEPIAELTISDTTAAATCEVLFCVLHQLGAYENMTREMAACLYCGLMTDTGAFAYNSNRASIFQIVAMLLAKGIDKDKIYRQVYYSYTESRLRLMGYLMYEKMEYFPEEHAALFTLTEEEMTRFNFMRGDAEGVVNMPLQIKGTKLSISLREDTEKPVVRVSLRSVGTFPCNEMAERFFNGGGHLNAAGGWLPKPMGLAVLTARRAIAAYRHVLEPKLKAVDEAKSGN
ncbi:MAG: DHH family phosphoesterase [Prevotellaceae bacterium]|nr:DHH family phosphoesterase [Prevotellaceae bacterium]